MKKLIIASCLLSSLSSFESFAGNLVPICEGVEQNKRNVVYKAITDNSFVTSLTPEKSK